MSDNTKVIENILSNEELEQIDKMIRKFNKEQNLELEVSFRNIKYSDYLRISEYYVNQTDENNISSLDSLDISINLSNNNVYRISIQNDDLIEKFIQKYAISDTNTIQRYLLSLEPNDQIEILYKNRGLADRYYVEELSMVIKLTEETPLTKGINKPKIADIEKMLFRYKNRFSFILSDLTRVDITQVQESDKLSNLSRRYPNYEVEMEIIGEKIKKNDFLSELQYFTQIIQNTDFPIGKNESKMVIQKYQSLLQIRPSNHLESRNVISIDTPHIIKFIPNRYAITDKADGERYFLFSIANGIYLLSTNLMVKKVSLPVNNAQYFDMLLDGELINKDEGELFMAFDVVYAEQIDYRFDTKYTLTQRLEVLNKIIDKCFGNLITFTDYTDKFKDMELGKIREFYSKELKRYWKDFTKRYNKKKQFFVSRKVYFVPYGIDACEVFTYADLLWKSLVYQNLTPYQLDGIIYTPINAPYYIRTSSNNLDDVPLEYKWKTPSQNSIDFYIQFEKDSLGKVAVYYDNTVTRAEGNPYQIARLMVGITQQGQEKPIPFKVNNVEQKANIYIKNDEAIDSNGDIINDNTVVEFIFDRSKNDVNDAYKWIALRTRYDKTESVQKYRKKYGNNLNIAIRIWKTIINPITEENIASLGNPTTFSKEMERLSKSKDVYQKQSFVYYQKKTGNASGMRAFNNWIKSNMILTYCLNAENVLDVGCGRGGDLIKFVRAKIKSYVGIDVDNNGLYTINSSAYNRYQNLKKSIPDTPPMIFIQADARALFNVPSQESAIPSINNKNKNLIEKHLANQKFDVINAQFSLHYYLSDELSWDNFCQNINNHLSDNGYFLITCFDGKLIYDQMIKKPKLTVSYTTNKGEKNIFFEIIKIYSEQKENGLGMAIDFYNSLISNPGVYVREYLVFPDFLEKSLHQKCGLELVESDSFYSLFNLYQNYFSQNKLEFALGDYSAKRHREIRDFYLSLQPNNHSDLSTEAAMASFKLSMLNRYYIFKKTTPINISNPSRIIGINHHINLGKILTPYFDSQNMVIDIDKRNQRINPIYHIIRRKHYQTRPSVYLIRHCITEDELDHQYYRWNNFEISKIKNGSDPKTLLIYKSPNKYFYPIYYRNTKYLDDDQVLDGQILDKPMGTYLFNSNQMIDDLDILVELTKKI